MKEYMVKIYANEGWVSGKDGKRIWEDVWTKFYNSIADAEAFMEYHRKNFPNHKPVLYERADGKWALIFDERNINRR